MQADFEDLINNQQGRIRAIARRYADSGHAEDLHQEILEQLWRSYKGFRGDASPETWVYRIGFNTAMTSLRKVTTVRKGLEKLKTFNHTESAPAGRCQAEILEDFMNSLNDIDASVLMMYLDGLSGQQMADVLGAPINNVQVRITRLKKAFSDRYVEET